jgi:hypothetical protein
MKKVGSAGLQTGCTGGVHVTGRVCGSGDPQNSRPGGRRYLFQFSSENELSGSLCAGRWILSANRGLGGGRPGPEGRVFGADRFMGLKAHAPSGTGRPGGRASRLGSVVSQVPKAGPRAPGTRNRTIFWGRSDGWWDLRVDHSLCYMSRRKYCLFLEILL